MVIEESQEGKRGEIQHLLGRTAPYRPAHREKVIVAEPFTEAILMNELSQRDGRIALSNENGGDFEETDDVAQHPPICGAKKIASLSEDGILAMRAIFQPAFAPLRMDADSKGHIALRGGDTQMLEQSRQLWIATMIKDDEPRIHIYLHARMVDTKRARMTADIIVFFINGNVMLLVQQPCRRIAGDAGADDCDFHKDSLRLQSLSTSYKLLTSTDLFVFKILVRL